MNNLMNHGKRYSQEDMEKLEKKAALYKSKSDMYTESQDLASEFGRTEAAICKMIEKINAENGREGWFWAKK